MFLFISLLSFPFATAIASGGGSTADLTGSVYGIIAILVFVLA